MIGDRIVGGVSDPLFASVLLYLNRLGCEFFQCCAIVLVLVPIVYKLVAVGEIKAELIVKEDQSSADTLAGFSLQKSWPA